MNRTLSPALQKLLAEYRAALPAKLANIERLQQAAIATEGDELAEYQRAVHQLAGSAGSYGLPEVSTAARALDRYLADVLAAETSRSAQRETELLTALRAAIQGAASA